MPKETFEEILNEMLDEVPRGYDKRVGSMIYNALAPVALKFASKNIEIEELENQIYPDTSSGTWLRREAKVEGIEPKEARAVQREVVFIPTEPPLETRFFSSDGLFWRFIESNTVVCEETGTRGNRTPVGDRLIPDSNIEGLESATLGEIKLVGANEEDEESLRSRLLDALANKKFNSNKAQIKSWAKEIQGVGDALVISLWDGANTVKVVIINQEKLPAEEALINEVQEYLDPITAPGQGEGQVDIGTVVTTESAKILSIDVKVKVKALPENLPLISDKLTALLENYRKDITFEADQVIYNYIGSLIFSVPEVENYKELELNNNIEDITIEKGYVPIFNVEVLPYE